MSAVWSSFKGTANNQRRFDKPWQLTDRIWKHCKIWVNMWVKMSKISVSKICVEFDARKKNIKLCSASRMTFRAWFYRTVPQSIGGQFGTLSGFLRNTFRKRTSQQKPRHIFQTKKFQDYFWETNTNKYAFDRDDFYGILQYFVEVNIFN